jgi:DNA methylase
VNELAIPMSRVPELIQRGRAELAGIGDPQDVADVERRAAAIAELTKRAGLSIPIQNEAMLYRAEALERLAVVVGEAQQNGEIADQGRPEKRSDARTFSDLKIDKRRLAEGRALAETDVLDKARLDAQRRPNSPIRFADIIIRANRIRRLDAGVEKREQLEREARTERARLEALGQQPFRVYHADVHQWRTGEPVDAIITDPPYVTADAVELYAALGDLALDCLKTGGVLAAMVWPPMLVDVVKALDRPGLAYRWSIVWQFTAHNNTGNLQRRVYDMTKLVLLYHRGEMPADAPYLTDLVQATDAEKDLHVWQQDLGGFEWLIERLTWPGDLICDPFIGSGTTAVAALRKDRQFIGCDIDPAAVEITRKRLEP